MREISAKMITEKVKEACIQANCKLPCDVLAAFEKGRKEEKSPLGCQIFDRMIENADLAARKEVPVCQDTGMAVIFAEIGQDAHIVDGDFETAVNEGVRRGYIDGYLRLSVVGDPMRRVNTNDNTPAIIHTTIVPGDQVHIVVAPKGFGSENMSAIKMFTPSATRDDVVNFIVDTMSKAGSNPCPPMIVGVGLGGTFEKAAILAKKAIATSLDAPAQDEFYAELEREITEKANKLGVGPQGFGGTVTALKVRVNAFGTHIAGLPCAVNIGCHVTRHAEFTL
ncbi:fumarate hydratase [Acidaminobacterium chupaoyuni]